jgi:hypothetical protein
MTLAADEFIRRFLLHVLPMGFHRIRHFGLIANNARKEKLALARELLNVQPTIVVASQDVREDVAAESMRLNFVCAHCGARMVVLEFFTRSMPIRAPPIAMGKP